MFKIQCVIDVKCCEKFNCYFQKTHILIVILYGKKLVDMRKLKIKTVLLLLLLNCMALISVHAMCKLDDDPMSENYTPIILEPKPSNSNPHRSLSDVYEAYYVNKTIFIDCFDFRDLARIEVYNVSNGKMKILENIDNNNDLVINISGMGRGYYILCISTESGLKFYGEVML